MKALFASIAILLAGCQTAEILTPVLLPVAVCKLIDSDAQKANYVRAVSLAVSAFASGGNLTPAELQAKLSAIQIDGLKPFETQAVWAVVVVAYTQLSDKYANDPNKVSELQRVLLSISAGLDSAVVQCGPKTVPIAAVRSMIVAGGGHVVPSVTAKDLANAIAKEIK